eukprot:TRINITY_DN893_c0_g1_i1.p1 TRINITY_DN893_c0_g1~~TRINITY_DN893_c0_g1_i1.p1  ORF type:complete len:1643 (-),score=201.44 TRINITY_DN893_c0_g1_i1:3482-8410(-)
MKRNLRRSSRSFMISSQMKLNNLVSIFIYQNHNKYPRKQQQNKSMENKVEESKKHFDEGLIKKHSFGNHTYLSNLWTDIFHPGDYTQLKQILDKISLPKGVCGRTFTKKDIGWFCKDCQRDPNCVICQDCFEQSNHTGHSVYLNRYVSGCCDCGDSDAMNPKGFCINHQGFVEESKASLDLLPNEYRLMIPKVISLLCLRLYSVCRGLKEYESNEDVDDEEIDKICEEVQALTNTIRQISDVTPIFLYVVCKELIKKQDHYYTENEWEDDSPEKLIRVTVPEEKDQTTTLEAIMEVHHMFPRELRKGMIEFLNYYLQSMNFRKFAAEAYLKNIRKIYNYVSSGGGKLTNLGVQVLSMDEVLSDLLNNPQYMQNILTTIKDTVFTVPEEVENEYGEEELYDKLDLLKKELSYAFKNKTVLKLIEVDFLVKYFEILRDATAVKTFHMLTTHLEEDPTYMEMTYGAECHLLKIFRMVSEGIDYANYAYCKHLAMAFKKELLAASSKSISIKQSYFSIPLHRCFAFFLINHVQVALLSKGIDPKADLGNVVREYLKQTFDFASDSEYDTFVKLILRPIMKSIGFFHEAAAKKWIYYGDLLDEINLSYVDGLGFFDAGLCTLMLSSVSDPSFLTSYIIDSLSQEDQWLFHYVTVLSNERKLSPDEIAISLTEKDIDLEKAKRILENALYFLCGLCTNDTLLLSFLWRALFTKRCKMEYQENFNTLLKPYRKYAIKKAVVHAYFQKKKLWVSFGKLKELVPRVYAKDAELLECLREIADKGKDKVKGKDVYCLKNEALKEYNPFYYVFTGKNVAGYEKCEETYKRVHNPAVFNPVFGRSSTGEFLKTIDFANAMRKTLARSDLSHWLIPVLSGHKEAVSDFQVLCALKLVQQCRGADGEEEKKMSEGMKAAISAGIKHAKDSMHQYEDLLNEYQKEFEGPIVKASADKGMHAKKMQQKILEEFKKRSTTFATKHKASLQDIPKLPEEEKAELTAVCAICKEALTEGNFSAKPYGKLFFASTSNVYYHYLTQAIDQQYHKLFKNRSGYTLGLSTTTCGHCLHYGCAAKILKKKPSKRSCPVCKASFIAILPNASSVAKVIGKDKSEVVAQVKEFLNTVITEYNNVEECIPEESDEEVASEEYLSFLGNIMSYNAYKIDCDNATHFLQKSEIYKSLFYSMKLALAEDLENIKAGAWMHLSDSLIESNLIDFLEEHKIDLLVTPILPVWSHMMLLLKLQEHELGELLPKVLDEYCTFFGYIHVVQAVIRQLFVANCRAIELDKLKDIITPSYLSVFVPLFAENIKKSSASLLSKALIIRQILFHEEKLQNLEPLFDRAQDQAAIFDKTVPLLGVSDILLWLGNPYHTFKYSQPLLHKLFNPSLLLESIQASLSSSTTDSIIMMPPELTLIGVTHDFCLLYLERTFSELEQIHYKRKCQKCGKQKRHNALCLLCGEILCISAKCCVENDEKELTRHTLECGSGKGFYLYFAQNMLIMMYGHKGISLPSIYVNQHGESVDLSAEDWFETLYLSPTAVQELITTYCQDKIPQTVVYQRKVKENRVVLDVQFKFVQQTNKYQYDLHLHITTKFTLQRINKTWIKHFQGHIQEKQASSKLEPEFMRKKANYMRAFQEESQFSRLKKIRRLSAQTLP